MNIFCLFSALRDASESEEAPNREGGGHNQDEDILEASRNEEGIQDDESDNEYTFNEPETESDSDDNQSNQDAQRSVQTGATVGSETGLEIIYYLFKRLIFNPLYWYYSLYNPLCFSVLY